MRNTFTLLFVLICFSANAQFSIQPQIGLENSRTTIKYNDVSCFSPAGMQFAPRIGLQLNYKTKSGHGAFVAIATGSSPVEFKFADPMTARTSYSTSANDIQLRLEGGYRFTTKPISLGGGSSSPASHKSGKGSCGSKSSSYNHSTANRCGKSSSKASPKSSSAKGWYMRITPSAGLAFAPSEKNKVETEVKNGQTTYEYKAGSWNTALTTGASFEFGTKQRSKFVININYLKGLGNNEGSVSSLSNGKTETTSFKSRASGFNVGLGIPISLAKSSNHNKSKSKQCHKVIYQSRCQQEYRIYKQ